MGGARVKWANATELGSSSGGVEMLRCDGRKSSR